MDSVKKKKYKHDFRHDSSRRCRNCGKPIKLNVTERQPAADHCYPCFMVSIGRVNYVKTYYDQVERKKVKRVLRFEDKIRSQKRTYMGDSGERRFGDGK